MSGGSESGAVDINVTALHFFTVKVLKQDSLEKLQGQIPNVLSSKTEDQSTDASG